MATQNEKSQAPGMFGDILRGMRRMTELAIAQTQVALLQTQMQMAHQWLEGTMKHVTPEVAHWLPAGKPGSIGAQYAHVALTEDYFIHRLLQSKTPLMDGSYAEKLGLPQLPPSRSNWGEWGRVIQVDLEQLRAYARAVYSA